MLTGSHHAYPKGEKITGINGNVTLYAQWTVVSLKMTKFKTIKRGKVLTLKAVLKLNGKAGGKQKIIFRFKGKQYKKTTDKKGIVKVMIKSKVTKKLKKGKRITIKASYGKVTVKQTAIVK